MRSRWIPTCVFNLNHVRFGLPFQPVNATLALPVSAGVFTSPVRGQLVISGRSSFRHALAPPSSAPLLASSEPMTPPSIPLQNLFKSLKSLAYAPSSAVLVKVLHRPIETAGANETLRMGLLRRFLTETIGQKRTLKAVCCWILSPLSAQQLASHRPSVVAQPLGARTS